MGRAMTQPERQAWALAYAMKARPTPELASRYFDAVKRMLGDAPGTDENANEPATAEGAVCRTRSIQPHC